MRLLGSFFVLLYANAAFAIHIPIPTPETTAANMLHNLGSVAGILGAVSAILGVSLVLGGFFRLKLYGQMRGTFMAHQVTIAGPLVKILAGAIMLVLPTMLHTSMLAFWGNANPLHIATTDGTSPWSAYVPVVIMFVRLIGVGAFIRGIMMLPRTSGQGKQPGVMSKALLHMLGGLLCINVVQTHILLRSILPI